MQIFVQEHTEVQRFAKLLAARSQLAEQAGWLQGTTDGAASPFADFLAYKRATQWTCSHVLL